jgi:hypothetical protein
LVQQLKKVSPGSVPRFAQSLAAALPRTTDPERHSYIILALGEIGPDANAAVPALLKAANSSDRLIAVQSIGSLTKIAPKWAATRMADLFDAMQPNQEPAVRLGALAALRDLGPAAATAVPALLKIVENRT